MWPLKMTARGAEFRWRWFQKSLWRLEVIWGHFGAILGPFRANLWPQIQNCRRLVMWPLKTTARGAELWWRWFQKSFSIPSGHFRPFPVHFRAIWGQFGPFLVLEVKLSQNSHVTTQNNREKGRWQLHGFQEERGWREYVLKVQLYLMKLSHLYEIYTRVDSLSRSYNRIDGFPQ